MWSDQFSYKQVIKINVCGNRWTEFLRFTLKLRGQWCKYPTKKNHVRGESCYKAHCRRPAQVEVKAARKRLCLNMTGNEQQSSRYSDSEYWTTCLRWRNNIIKWNSLLLMCWNNNQKARHRDRVNKHKQ
jgi:hypothetical protein